MKSCAPQHNRVRRVGVVSRRAVRRALVTLGGVGLGVSLVGGHSVSAASGPIGGAVLTAPSSGAALMAGGSDTEFSFMLPAGAACPGGAVAGYRWQTFLASSAVALDSLQFGVSGPTSASGRFVSYLYAYKGGQAVLNVAPAVEAAGSFAGIPTFSFSRFAPGVLAPGDYNLGVACSLNGESVAMWSATVTLVADLADTPTGVRWGLKGYVAPPSGGVSVVVPPPSNTTPAPAVDGAPSTTQVGSGAPVATPPKVPSGGLPFTGWSPQGVLVWGSLLTCAGVGCRRLDTGRQARRRSRLARHA